MGVMPVIILLSLVVAGGFAIVFVISARTGQYDDTVTPPIRMLFEDDAATSDSGALSSAEEIAQNSFSNNLHRRM